MKTYQVAIVEDNPADQQALLEIVQRVPFLHLTGTFADPVVALSFLTTNPVDLLLLDLEMPGLSGFDLLRSLTHPPAVIMTTASLAGPLEGFELGVVDYMIKPIKYERFLRAVGRLISQQTGSPVLRPTVLVLKQGFLSVRVVVADISHVEATREGSSLYLADGSVVTVTPLLAELQERLAGSAFARIHRSYLVAVSRIAGFSSREVIMAGETRLRIGRAYLPDFLRLMHGNEPG